MYWDVKKVEARDDYQLYVELADGRKGTFDMKPYLNIGVFKDLRDKEYFEQVGIFLGAVTWPNEQDIAPETLVAGLMQKKNVRPEQTDAVQSKGIARS